jgi:hypothetical protein
MCYAATVAESGGPDRRKEGIGPRLGLFRCVPAEVNP